MVERSILELVHTYVCGPMQTQSLVGGGHLTLFYFLMIELDTLGCIS